MTEPILTVQDLAVTFDQHEGDVTAVDKMSFTVGRGEIFGLVGESGSGKSVTGMAILRMIRPPGRITGGSITFQGTNLLALPSAAMRQYRGARIALVSQDPATALSPVFRVEQQIVRLARLHRGGSRAEARDRCVEMLTAVGLPEPNRVLASYPHQLSGGMQQRVMIAMALACGADLLIADEPTTALDVTVQAQILDLLAVLRERDGLSILFVTHDLGVVAELCDRVGVARHGRIVETGTTEQVLQRPTHEYTKSLLSSLPETMGTRASATSWEVVS